MGDREEVDELIRQANSLLESDSGEPNSGDVIKGVEERIKRIDELSFEKFGVFERSNIQKELSEVLEKFIKYRILDIKMIMERKSQNPRIDPHLAIDLRIKHIHEYLEKYKYLKIRKETREEVDEVKRNFIKFSRSR